MEIKGSSSNDAMEYVLQMLKEGNGNSDRRNRSTQQGTESKSIQIDSSAVGLVIGRGGARIREIENNHSVKLNIGKYNISIWRQRLSVECQSLTDRQSDQNGQTTIAVNGSSHDAIDRAIAEINDVTKERNQSRNYSSSESKPAFQEAPRQEPAPVEDDFEPIDWQAAARESVIYIEQGETPFSFV